MPLARLMRRAGRAICTHIQREYTPCPVVVACGPGHNGGDGFVAARLLRAAGWPVRVGLWAGASGLRPATSEACAAWDAPCAPLTPALLSRVGLVVDAVFGAGCRRPLPDPVEAFFAQVRVPMVAVDVPSGVDGRTGQLWGQHVVQAESSITFMRKKPGHLLLPGRRKCGKVVVVPLGVENRVLPPLALSCFENDPELWRHALPRLRRVCSDHKYAFGHVLVICGQMTGAARLVATAALRCGAGVVRLAAPSALFPLLAGCPAAVIVARLEPEQELEAEIAGQVVVIGPGAGLSLESHAVAVFKARVCACLRKAAATVLDAQALSLFADEPQRLFAALAQAAGPRVLTPHRGEFARLFPDLSTDDSLTAARKAAQRAQAVVILKGEDTVVAAPDGWAAISGWAPPFLATAGTGDVLAGMVGALLAQGLCAARAAAAAVWLHAAAARKAGVGMIADDLPAALPGVWLQMVEAAAPPL